MLFLSLHRRCGMFGYVKLNSPEAKVKEYEFYRGTYCGLCRAMGKCTGQCSRMTLSYDFVFLALTRLALLDEKVTFKQKRCLAHPFTKRNSMLRNETLDYCSRAAAILNYHKVADDLKDESGFKRFRSRLALPFVSHARKKALKKEPELKLLDDAVSRELKVLDDIETSNKISVDTPADSFGRLLGEIMSFGLEGSSARIAYEIGRGVGGWIYIADAIDDMREDSEKKRYNPILRLYNGSIPSAEQLSFMYDAVKLRLTVAESAFDLVSTENEMIENILKNILFIGIPDKTEEIMKKYENNENQRKEPSDD